MPHTHFWTDEERVKLRKLVAQGLTHEALAERFGRGVEAVRHQIGKMGLAKKPTRTGKRKPPIRHIPRPGKSTLPSL